MWDNVDMPRFPSSDSLTCFGTWLQARGINYAEAAEALGISRQHARFVAIGNAVPSLALAGKIATWTKSIDSKSWVAAEDWEAYKSLLRR